VLRMRVFRLSVPFTLMGVELWAFGVVGIGTVVSLQWFQQFLPSILPFPAAGATGLLLLKIISTIKRFFPGRAFIHLLSWLTAGDRYVLEREKRCLPLVVPDEESINRRLAQSRPRTRPVQTSTPLGALVGSNPNPRLTKSKE
jgi:hypothetical protein